MEELEVEEAKTYLVEKGYDFDVVVVVVVVVLLRTRFKCWKAAGMGKELERVLRIVLTFFGSEVTVRKGTVLVGSNGMTVRTCVMVVIYCLCCFLCWLGEK